MTEGPADARRHRRNRFARGARDAAIRVTGGDVYKLTPPSDTGGLLGVLRGRRRYLLRVLVRREVQARYSGSFLGMFWSYLMPAARFGMYFFVFSMLLGRGDIVENFAIHLFAGMVVVHYFTETFSAGTRSLMRNSQIISKMSVPREMFPVASMLVSAYHVLPGSVLLVIVCLLNGWTPDFWGIVAGAMGMTLIGILGTASGLLFSVLNVYFRDFGNVVNILTMFTTFSVPMMYPYTVVSERFEGHTTLYLANPLVEAVLLFQRCFWVGTTDNPEKTAVQHFPPHLFNLSMLQIGVALLFLLFAQFVFSRLEKRIPERV